MGTREGSQHRYGTDHYAITGNSQRTEAWSIKRLPFEPTDWRRGLRSDLRESVGRLVCPPDQVLHGVYLSAVRDSCDTENILFYNLGAQSFSQAAHRGLRFERVFTDPPPPPQSLWYPPLHYQCYEFKDWRDRFTYWDQHRTLARWSSVEFASIKSVANPSVMWLLMKSAEVVTEDEALRGKEPFGLSVVIGIPPTAVRRTANLVALVKPIFDGIIASFHVYDGNQLDEVCRRLAEKLGRSPVEIANRLTTDTTAPLGRRPLLHLRGEGIQWNPADDRCVAGELLIEETGPGRTSWDLSGHLFAVTSRGA